MTKIQGFARSVIAVSVAMAVSSVSFAQEVVDSGVTLSAGAAYNKLDSYRDLDDKVAPEVGIGYRFNDRFSVDGVYSQYSTDQKNTNANADLKEFRLDAYYDLTPWDGSFTPYVVAGVGRLDTDLDNLGSDDDTRLNGGVGLRKAITPNLSVRGDLRAARSLEHGQTEGAMNVALTWTFGSVESAPQPVVVVVEEEIIIEPVVVIVDTDNDGVLDANDQCPNTPVNTAVNASGCELYEDMELMVKFGFNSTVVEQQDYAVIGEMAELLERHPTSRISITGYTDNAGPAAYNQKLSLKRAEAIRDVLVTEYNVEASRIDAIGMGEADPISGNDTEEGREQNRRVVINSEMVVNG